MELRKQLIDMPFHAKSYSLCHLSICGGFRYYPAETATNGVVGPLVAPMRRAVAPMALGRGANRRHTGGATQHYGWRQLGCVVETNH